MKVTVCELRNDPEALEMDWLALVAHTRSEGSELVLLPEMPFYPWIARSDQVDPAIWQASVEKHDRWISQLTELAPAIVAGTRPVFKGGKRLNEGYIWEPRGGYQAVHAKYYLPDEKGFWEASWYERGERDFSTHTCHGVKIGYLICTELWFNFHAREYAKQGIHLLVCPRATPEASVEKWIAGGRTAAVVSGAYCLSANIGGTSHDGMQWGGHGWIIEPQEGKILGTTTQADPFLTLDIDPEAAESAKHTYPRYVLD